MKIEVGIVEIKSLKNPTNIFFHLGPILITGIVWE